MTQEIVSDGSDASDGRNGVISEVVKALENAGVASDVAAAVTSNLMKGGIEIIEEDELTVPGKRRRGRKPRRRAPNSGV
ncbi:MAG: hypothetical protein VYC23_02775 [Chloroflexota bacterium]|nr:hypothetical protein [Chloroflexota bacterium]